MEFIKDYQPAKFQFCTLSGSRFTEGPQKHNDDVISYFWDSKFQYFVTLVISYQPVKFNPILDVGGGKFAPPSWFFEYSSETVRSRKLKLCDF